MRETCRLDGRTTHAKILDCEKDFRELCSEESKAEKSGVVIIPMALYGSIGSDVKILDPYPDDRAA